MERGVVVRRGLGTFLIYLLDMRAESLVFETACC